MVLRHSTKAWRSESGLQASGGHPEAAQGRAASAMPAANVLTALYWYTSSIIVCMVKTHLERSQTALRAPSSGRALVAGSGRARLPPPVLPRRTVAAAPQISDLDPEL
eukprot:361145-Chlamydomonas_euryale.AAC.2